MLSLSAWNRISPFFVAALLLCSQHAVAEDLSPAKAECSGPFHAAYRILDLPDGKKASLWYPTNDPETSFAYPSGRKSALAVDGAVSHCGPFPAILFSHGYLGCSVQSLQFTETAARRGYIVIAPDHHDALCKTTAGEETGFHRTEESFVRVNKWTEETYTDRRDDLRESLKLVLALPQIGASVDRENMAISGHSLGGYTAAGMAGGWEAWRDPRFKAALLFSPYVEPFIQRQRLEAISIPVMFQGGERDRGITPTLIRKDGAYAVTRAPKFFIELRDATHYIWTNLACDKNRPVASCADTNRNVALSNQYAFAFLDHYLKGAPMAPLETRAADLLDFRFDSGDGPASPAETTTPAPTSKRPFRDRLRKLFGREQN